MPLRDRLRRAALPVTFVVCITALAVHFAMTVVFLMPLNPVRVALLPYVEGYMRPLFDQNWDLFAPDPSGSTHYLLVSCRIPAEDGTVRETPWMDTTTRLYEQHYRNRLGPGVRIARVEVGSVHLVLPHVDDVSEKVRTLSAEDPLVKEAVAEIDKGQEYARELGKNQLARSASVECDRQFGAGVTREVRVRILAIQSPPFTMRDQPLGNGQRHNYEFDWMPYQQVDGY